MNDIKFLMINNNIVKKIEEVESYINTLDVNLLGVICYLNMRVDRTDSCNFTLGDMIHTLGYKSDTHKYGINNKIKNILKVLQTKEFIIYYKDLNNIKANEFISCKIDNNKLLEHSKDGECKSYFKLPYNYIVKIFTNKDYKNKIDLLNVYSYLLSCANTHKADVVEIIMCYPSLLDIMENCNINSKTTVSTILRQLENLELIKYSNIGIIKKDKESREANNVYVFTKDKDTLSCALSISKFYYQQRGYTVVSGISNKLAKYKRNKKKNRKAYLKRKINSNKANEEEIKEYIKLGGKVNTDNID